MTCPECGRPMHPGEERIKHVSATRDEPSYAVPACKRCAPSEEDTEADLDAHYERLLDEARENGWAI